MMDLKYLIIKRVDFIENSRLLDLHYNFEKLVNKQTRKFEIVASFNTINECNIFIKDKLNTSDLIDWDKRDYVDCDEERNWVVSDYFIYTIDFNFRALNHYSKITHSIRDFITKINDLRENINTLITRLEIFYNDKEFQTEDFKNGILELNKYYNKHKHILELYSHKYRIKFSDKNGILEEFNFNTIYELKQSIDMIWSERKMLFRKVD